MCAGRPPLTHLENIRVPQGRLAAWDFGLPQISYFLKKMHFLKIF
jgi:hypothetical protein